MLSKIGPQWSESQSGAQNNTWLLIPPPAQNFQISAAKKASYNFPQHYYRGTRKIIR